MRHLRLLAIHIGFRLLLWASRGGLQLFFGPADCDICWARLRYEGRCAECGRVRLAEPTFARWSEREKLWKG